MKNLSLAIGSAGIALLSGAVIAQTNTGAQTYPVRPIRIIVPNTAGSATDIATRLIAQRLTDSMGHESERWSQVITAAGLKLEC